MKNERCVTVELIEKRALILSVTTQVNKKEKQMLDNNTNKRRIYKRTVSLLLEFFLVPTKIRHIDVETLHKVVDM